MTSKPAILAATLAASLFLPACSSDKKSSGDDTGPKYAQRSSKSNWSDKHRSSFEKQAGKAEKTKSVKTGSFHTSNYTAAKSAGGMDKQYRSKDYSQGDKKDKSFEKSYSGTKESKLGSEQYKTSGSHLADQKSHDEGRMNHDAGKSFSSGSESYKTNSDAIGSKASQNAQKSKGVQTGKPSYTEDEVRGLLNKG